MSQEYVEFLERLLSRIENSVTPSPLQYTMSPEFLERLLSTPENRVRSKQGSSCMICLEDYNTLNTSTGVVEWEIRLPCGHGVGSSCIVAWLRTNNSCPACRATFFPQQPRPQLEHDIVGRASMAPAPALIRLPELPARMAPVPTTTYRAVLKTLMNLVLKAVQAFAISLAIVFIATALLDGVGIFTGTYLPGFHAFLRRIVELLGWKDFSSSSPSAEPPSEGPAIQTRLCMDWQDCSFLSSRSR